MSGTLTRIANAASTIAGLFGSPAVQLDDFIFTDFEVPERMRWGGQHSGTVHRLIGDGRRVLDKTGPDEAPIEWSGILLGINAKDRARDLNALREDGGPFDLNWNGSSQRVFVRECTFDEGYAQIGYRIACEIIPLDEDDTEDQQYGPPAATKDGLRLDGALTSVSHAVSDFRQSSIGQALTQGLAVAQAVGVPGAALIGTAANVSALSVLNSASSAMTGLRDATSATLTAAGAISTVSATGFGGVLAAAQNAATLAGGMTRLARAAALLRG